MIDSALADDVREILATTLGMHVESVAPDESQATCGRWTSVYHLMLLVALEDQFGVSFSMDQMTSMTSVARIVDVLRDHVASAVR